LAGNKGSPQLGEQEMTEYQFCSPHATIQPPFLSTPRSPVHYRIAGTESPPPLDPLGPRIIVAAGLITDGERLLIARRGPEGSFPGCWEFPGGKIEPGESLETALVRECEEEIGLTVNVIRQVARVNFPHNDGHLTLEIFLCRVDGTQEPQCIEVSEVKWVYNSQLLEYQFPPANTRLVVQLAELEWRDWVVRGSQLWI